MKVLKSLLKYILPPIIGFVLSYLKFQADLPIYYRAFRSEILMVLIVFILLDISFDLYSLYRKRLEDFEKNFHVYKPISKLGPSDFGIFTYNETYITRKSDEEIKNP